MSRHEAFVARQSRDNADFVTFDTTAPSAFAIGKKSSVLRSAKLPRSGQNDRCCGFVSAAPAFMSERRAHISRCVRGSRTRTLLFPAAPGFRQKAPSAFTPSERLNIQLSKIKVLQQPLGAPCSVEHIFNYVVNLYIILFLYVVNRWREGHRPILNRDCLEFLNLTFHNIHLPSLLSVCSRVLGLDFVFAQLLSPRLRTSMVDLFPVVLGEISNISWLD